MVGVKIGEFHTWNDWSLYLQSIYISPPIAKKHSISVPGQDGELDLSEALTAGEVKYQNRTITLEFEGEDGNYERMLEKSSKIAMAIQGKTNKIILDDDIGHYYIGKCTVDIKKKNSMVSSLVITCEVSPYKHYIQTSLEDWLFNSFNFHTGVIRTAKNIAITPSNHFIDIPSGSINVVPVFRIESYTSKMSLIFGGQNYLLNLGENRFPEIRIGKERVRLLFGGEGIISVDYRGGAL